MFAFIVRRLLLLFPVLIGILVVTFTITRMIPGDPCDAMLGEKATKAKCKIFQQHYGLDKSIPEQFLRYTLNVAQGDFGTAIRDRRPVTDLIAERLPLTIELTVIATVFASTVGILLGVVAALNRNSAADTATMVFANIGVSMPIFWLGLLLAYFFSLTLKDTPFFIPPSSRLSPGVSIIPLAKVWGLQNLKGFQRFMLMLVSNSAILNALLTGNTKLLKDALWHLILPALAVGTISLSVIARMTRSSLLDVLGEDYVRTARSKGLRERLIIYRHALRNALIPIVTIIGLQIGSLLSGAVLTETIFGLPGVGSRAVEAILSRDYPIIQGFSVLVAVIYVFTNLIVDISYAYLDPRIRLK